MDDTFVIELSVGGARFKLSTENNESFSLKRSAEQVVVDFVNFTGSLLILRSGPVPEKSAGYAWSTLLKGGQLGIESNKTAAEKTSPIATKQGEHNMCIRHKASIDRDEQLEGETKEIERDQGNASATVSNRDMCTRLKESIDRSMYEQLDGEVKVMVETSATETTEESIDRDVGIHSEESIDRIELLTKSLFSVTSTASELHRACARPCVSVKTLQAILDATPQAASETDAQGRYPLHILSENKDLLASFAGDIDARTFSLSLFEAYPEALTSKDRTGDCPFDSLFQSWVQNAYMETNEKETSRGVVHAIRSAAKMNSISSSRVDQQREPSFSRNRYPNVLVTPEVQVSFEIISSYFDRLNSSDGQHGFDRETNLYVRAALARRVANVPCLLKTVFLIDDNVARLQVIRSSAIQRVLLCSASVGEWVDSMLRHGGVVSKRAVDYLEEVSRLTVTDFVGPRRSARPEDIEAFQHDRTEVFDTLEASGQMIASLTVLNDEEKGRAATTDAVWLILNHRLSRPLVVGILLADLVFNIALLVTFRYVNYIYLGVLFGAEDKQSTGVDSIVVSSSLILYFLVRKLCEFYSLLRLSTRAFRNYAYSLWNVVDVSAIVLAAIVTHSDVDNPTLLALSVAALWMKLLGFFKAINAHLATFILAILVIVKDIKWFVLVFLLFLFMFADIIHILTLHAYDGAFCKDGTAPEEFCSPAIGIVWLKLFSVIVGDVQLSDFAYDDGIELVFALFMFLGVIVMLNVLIAVVGDSYKRSVTNARQLFGRARVDFAVTLDAQDQFLRGRAMPRFAGVLPLSDCDHTTWLLAAVSRSVAVTALLWTSIITMYFMVDLPVTTDTLTVGEMVLWICLAFVFGLCLLAAIPLVLHGMFKRPLRRVAARLDLRLLVALLDFFDQATQLLARRIFGIGMTDSYGDGVEVDPRVRMLQNAVVEVMVSTKDMVVRSMEAVEERIKAHATFLAEGISNRMEVLSH